MSARRLLTGLAMVLAVSAADAAPPPVRYVSQRPAQAYLREGPSYAHKILWVYRHKGYPFAVTASYDIWRRVVDADGTVGWMSASMLTDARTVLVTGKGQARITAAADPNSRLVGLANPGAVASLKACEINACHIAGQAVDGWISKDRIWGVDKNEVFAK
jgi:SH3-like domain-containing protein